MKNNIKNKTFVKLGNKFQKKKKKTFVKKVTSRRKKIRDKVIKKRYVIKNATCHVLRDEKGVHKLAYSCVF